MSLSSLFVLCTSNASKISNASVQEETTQHLIEATLADLSILSSRIAELLFFSPNETLDDISTKDMIYMLVPFVTAAVRGRIKTDTGDKRLYVLRQTEEDLDLFVYYVETFDIVTKEDRILYEHQPSEVIDAVKRRELRIKQYQKEKELRQKIESVHTDRLRSTFPQTTISDLDHITSLLLTLFPTNNGNEKEPPSETDEGVREVVLLLIRFFYSQTRTLLENLTQEAKLLSTAPSSNPGIPENAGRGEKARGSQVDEWMLIASDHGQGRKGSLLDPFGKPLRPFTIVPSGSADRARFQSQVFGPGYTLPTMSIDEYLDIERQRGNILIGGGPASEVALSSSEQLALDSEMDGTVAAELKAEVKRLKEENWARFTDDNPRGAGNTMNQG